MKKGPPSITCIACIFLSVGFTGLIRAFANCALTSFHIVYSLNRDVGTVVSS